MLEGAQIYFFALQVRNGILSLNRQVVIDCQPPSHPPVDPRNRKIWRVFVLLTNFEQS